jgi:hypothetical protein
MPEARSATPARHKAFTDRNAPPNMAFLNILKAKEETGPAIPGRSGDIPVI